MRKIVYQLLIVIMLASCSAVKPKETLQKEYSITKESAKNWDQTIIQVLTKEALIDDWYGGAGENPIIYLRKTGKMNEKEFRFLMELNQKNPKDITEEDLTRFLNLVEKYNNKLPRKFYLKDENIKNAKGLIDKIVGDSLTPLETPSKHIKEKVAIPEEWEDIVVLSKKGDLNEKDTKKLRKLLNKFIKRDEFYSTKAWYNTEISDRVMEIDQISKKPNISKLERNNVNAKALYIAYPDFLAPLTKWDD